jgi:uncharacterized protein YkwD
MRRLTVVLAAAIAGVMVLGVSPAPVGAATTSSMADSVVGWMNRDREARGLSPYRRWAPLTQMAEERASRMASRNTLSHDAAGPNIGDDFSARGIQWYAYGECIGVSSYSWGSKAAANLYSMWKNSPPHAAIMFSSRFNYIGVGFSYRASNNTTWASMVFAESKDHTGPVAHKAGLDANGTTIVFKWKGHDRQLQTHTAGLGTYDVQYRVDDGSWRTIRNDTTTTSLTLRNRAHGHWYRFRVQAKDRRGNLSEWTSAGKVWVP